jgi:hypothetical protein
MLSFFYSVLSSSLASKLLRRLMPSWPPLFVVNAPCEELVQFVARMIVGSNVKVSDPPAPRLYHTGA